MPDQNHNSPREWQERLEALDQLPDIPPFNKNGAWEKLYSRLEQPENKNKKAWLWMAAAFMIGVLFAITWFNYMKINNPVSLAQPQSSIQKENHELTANTIVQPVITHPGNPPSTRQQSKVKDALQVQVNANQARHPLLEKEINPVLPAATLSNGPDLAIPTNIDSPVLAIVPGTGTRKKMAVVYLNEIEAGNPNLQGNRRAPKNHRSLYPKFGQTGSDDIYASSQPERFTITISSAN